MSILDDFVDWWERASNEPPPPVYLPDEVPGVEVIPPENEPIEASFYDRFFGEGELAGVTVPAKPRVPSRSILESIGLPTSGEGLAGSVRDFGPLVLAALACAALWGARRYLKRLF